MSTAAEPETNYLREIVLDSNRDLPLHAQLRKALERLITEHFDDQSRFYSESQLVTNLRVSQGTVRRALADLATRGMLEKRQARCTIVCKQPPGAELKNLAVFLPDYTSPSVAKLLGLLNAECQNRGIRMHPIYTHRGDRLLNAYNNLLFASHEGSVVLLENSPRATVELAAALGDKGYDFVVVDTILRGEMNKFVGGRNDSMIRRGMEHLVGLGHRRITLLVNEPEEKESVQERIAAFESWTSREAPELRKRIIYSGAHLWDDAYDAAQKAMEEAMKGPAAQTAVFAVSDVGALAAIKWLQQRGHRVPEDISVIGIGGIDAGMMIHPSLTTLSTSPDEIAHGVFALLTSDDASMRSVMIEPELLVRESTAPPAA